MLMDNHEMRGRALKVAGLLAAVAIVMLIGTSLVSAETLGDFPTVKQHQCIQLLQTCADCDYVNITTILYPNKTIQTVNAQMTKIGQADYNYSFCKTNVLGQYVYNTLGNPNGTLVSQPVQFEVTPNGLDNEIWYFIVIIALFYVIGFVGYFGKNEWVSILGGFGMMAMGIYFVNNGIDLYRDFITKAVSYISIGLGALFSIHAAVSLIEENV